MLSVAVVGPSGREWCGYFKHVPLHDQSKAMRCVVASPKLALNPQGSAQDTYRDLVRTFTSSAVSLQLRLDGSRLIQEALKLFSGIDGVAAGSCVAGLFTAEGAAMVSSIGVEVHQLRSPASRGAHLGRESLSETGSMRLFQWPADELHAALIPARPGLIPEQVARRLFKPGDSREQVVEKLCGWIRKKIPDQPTLVLVYGQSTSIRDIEGSLFDELPPPRQNGELVAPPTHPQGPFVPDGLAELRADLSQLPGHLETAAHRAMAEFGGALAKVKEWPAAGLFGGLVDRLEAAQAEHVEQHVLMPLCRRLMSLYDMTRKKAEESEPDEFAQAVAQDVLSLLEEHDITPFSNGESSFNPLTQEVAESSRCPGPYKLKSLRCGFRKGSKVIRREKVVFSPIAKSLMESVS
ncbi:MAG: hypothetical protein DPW13_06695 [Planctomycetes bacterium]|nr:hypothetical protein [Planctomycetota bacterium]